MQPRWATEREEAKLDKHASDITDIAVRSDLGMQS